MTAQEEEKKPKLILVWSSKGGVGKTTCIHNIATALSSDPFNYEILVADSDKQASLAVIENPAYEVTEITTKAVIDSFDGVTGYDYVFLDLAGAYDEESTLYGEHVQQIIEMAHIWFIPYTADQLGVMGGYQAFDLLGDYAQNPVWFFENMAERRTILNREMNNELDQIFAEGVAKKMKSVLSRYQAFKKMPEESIYNGSMARKEVILFKHFIKEFNQIITS